LYRFFLLDSHHGSGDSIIKTNVSYGLPARKLINYAFLSAAIAQGLVYAIIDPTDKQFYAMMKAVTMVVGKDDYCMDFICAFCEGHVE
jgi:5-methyltetrahydrofolate corrinoid/iron sulfur protein methyltransferase